MKHFLVSSVRVLRRPLAWLALTLALLLIGLGVDWWVAFPANAERRYVGRSSCTQCHAVQVHEWAGSHHDHAMEPATPESVLGNFDDQQFEHFGVTSRMQRRDGKYWITTDNAAGDSESFEVKYTFGYEPLQQYLVEFDDGRVQALSVAWDTQQQRWFHLYPDEQIAHDDPLHWTARSQNWNYMCAECHSTDLKKNYDVASNTYDTTFAEIDVSCEACHGPASLHVELAESKSLFWDRIHGYGLAPLKSKSSKVELETCARCHSRRRVVYPGFEPGDEFLDYYAPELIVGELYHDDGQIQDEVYEYGSFLQSRMYREGVRCSDCHNPHTVELRAPGNQLCVRCHVPAKYDSQLHYFHPVDSPGAACVNCHMPEKTYMVVDPRRDHSLRVPRPDLTVEYGTPNACNDCHDDKSAEWARDQIVAWYGPQRAGTPPYAHAFAAAREGLPEAVELLSQVARRRDVGPFVRASALARLGEVPGPSAREVAERELNDSEPLVRAAAVGYFEGEPAESLAPLLTPRLDDPIRLVRTEAARLLSRAPARQLSSADRRTLDRVLKEYEEGQIELADQPAARLNLGVVHENLGQTRDALRWYRSAVELDPEFIPAKNNLALLLHAQGDVQAAEQYFRDVIALQPEFAAAQYSLGLLLAEQPGRLEEAVEYLAAAARLEPDNARMHYNLGLAYQHLERSDEAAEALHVAQRLAPEDADLLYAVVHHYAQAEDWSRAIDEAQKLRQLRPGDAEIDRLLGYLRQQAQAGRAAGPALPNP